MILPKLFS